MKPPASGSDFVVLTSDNPRSEDPLAIINDAARPACRNPARKYTTEPDRRKAIALAIGQATPGDIVLLAGKGHERTQTTREGSIPFDDVEVAREVLAAAGYECVRPFRQAPQGAAHEAPDFAHRRILAATGQYEPSAIAQGYSIDSRTVQPGELFFAVKGERFDGHDFVDAALSQRRSRRSSSQRSTSRAIPIRKSLLAVDDTLVALQTSATAVRKLWGKTAIGVTGSMGKTTTKEAVAHLLRDQIPCPSHQRQFNNHFGLPLGLLTLEPEYDIAVVEMGMSHAGEIAALARIALPNEGLVTNVGPVHLEFFDSIAGIARAKYELIESLPATGTAFLNADDEYVSQFGRDFKGKVILFGLRPIADVRAEKIEARRQRRHALRPDLRWPASVPYTARCSANTTSTTY